MANENAPAVYLDKTPDQTPPQVETPPKIEVKREPKLDDKPVVGVVISTTTNHRVNYLSSKPDVSTTNNPIKTSKSDDPRP